MLDENLPTFHFKPSSDNPLNNVIYFTQNGDEPAPEYLLRRADPAAPSSRNKFAAALADPYSPDVVYAECVVEPEWAQPSLSAAELRAQQNSQHPAPVPATATVPDTFALQLYNPDQVIAVKTTPGSWNKSESWEFEMPTQSFRLPSTSELDRQQQGAGGPAPDLAPKIMFRWRKDGRLSKDMTCYMTGKSLGGRKSKEPDITVALYKHGRDNAAVTIYEPNLQRVEVEDRKGLEIALVLGAEVIKELYLTPKQDVFNVTGAAPASYRKNSRPSAGVAAGAAGTPSPPGPAMSGAIAPPLPPSSSRPHAASAPQAAALAAIPSAGSAGAVPAAASSASIDAETRRLQAIVEKEKRDREREERDREKRDREEQKRIKKMLDEEDKERRRRDAEVAKETERLRKMYGVEGQKAPAGPAGRLPPRPSPQQQNVSFLGHAPPQRPISADPSARPRPVPQQQPGPGPFNSPVLNSWWGGPSAPPAGPQTVTLKPPEGSRVGQFFHMGSGGGGAGGGASDRQKIQKKRSMHW